MRGTESASVVFYTTDGTQPSNAIVDRELEEQRLTLFEETASDDALFRYPSGSLDVHSLFGNVAKLLKLARREKLPSPDPDTFSFADLHKDAKKAQVVTINFNSSNTIKYMWEGAEWKRYEAGLPFMSTSGAQIGVANLVIMQVDVNNSSTIVDVAGNPSPDIDLVSSGKALLFRDGKVVKGIWDIADTGIPPSFTTKAGEPFTFRPGSIWIELVPSTKGTVKGSFDFSRK